MNLQNKSRHQFLLSFFTGDKYEEKNINGFWLVKHFDGNTKKWTVNVYSEENFVNYKTRMKIF
jgi:hypothetical protein